MNNEIKSKVNLFDVMEITKHRKPDFNNLTRIFNGGIPERPTLFEFYLNNRIYKSIVPDIKDYNEDYLSHCKALIKVYRHLGYDYITIPPIPAMQFKMDNHETKDSISLNDQALITDWKSFYNYPWPDPDVINYSFLEELAKYTPQGMKIIGFQPNGLLENTISLIGFDKLCYMLFDQFDLVKAVVDRIGDILLRFYRQYMNYDVVGACFLNDDWGFNHQTMLSPTQMRELIIPWHKKIVTMLHENNRYALMHSCGMLWDVMEDIINEIKFDAKHSYEDNITPVEEAYNLLKGRIAVLGGLDVDFMCRKTPVEIAKRASALVKEGMTYGGYALGTGNSVPEYLPDQNYYAMIYQALCQKKTVQFENNTSRSTSQ